MAMHNKPDNLMLTWVNYVQHKRLLFETLEEITQMVLKSTSHFPWFLKLHMLRVGSIGYNFKTLGTKMGTWIQGLNNTWIVFFGTIFVIYLNFSKRFPPPSDFCFGLQFFGLSDELCVFDPTTRPKFMQCSSKAFPIQQLFCMLDFCLMMA